MKPKNTKLRMRSNGNILLLLRLRTLAFALSPSLFLLSWSIAFISNLIHARGLLNVLGCYWLVCCRQRGDHCANHMYESSFTFHLDIRNIFYQCWLGLTILFSKIKLMPVMMYVHSHTSVTYQSVYLISIHIP